MSSSRPLIAEVLLLAVASLGVALLVNTARGTSGLDLGKDYFPASTRAAQQAEENAGAAQNQEGSSSKPQHGFQAFQLEDAQAYQPYAAARDGVVFLDARSRKLYEAGHIPGARLCHHYRQDEYLPGLLDELRAADVVVIYCAGGDCEDSIQLATDLVFQYALPQELLAIYEGGYEEWVEAGGAVVEGADPGGDSE
ncbi:MAG: hypothetical protein CMJ94_13115 [Planctomycetes bacterium]|nr:hypothetical protein [Planctomycetota bacterium]